MQGAGFRVQGAGCRVQGAGFRIQGSGCRAQGSGRAMSLSDASKRMARRVRRKQGYLAHKKAPPLGPYSRPEPRALWRSWGVGRFLMREVPL